MATFDWKGGKVIAMNWYTVHYLDGECACEKQVQAHGAADAIVCIERSNGGDRRVCYVTCIEDPRKPSSPSESADVAAVKRILARLPKGAAITGISGADVGYVVEYTVKQESRRWWQAR